MVSPRLLAVDVEAEAQSSDTDEVLQRAAGRLGALQGRAVGAVALGLLGLAGVTLMQGAPKLRMQSHAPEAAAIEEFSLFGSGSSGKKKPSTKPSTSSGSVQWYLGKAGETCDMTCSALTKPVQGGVMECSEKDFASAKGQTGMKSILNILKPKKIASCKKSTSVTATKYNKASNPAPQVSSSLFSGTTCQYSTAVATCGAAPASGFQRACPCKKAVQQLQWRTGKASQSCDAVCLDITKKQPNMPVYCDSKALSAITSKNNLQVALNNAHPKKLKCTAKEDRTIKDGPEYTAGMLSSTCAYSKSPSTCAAVPKGKKAVRLCPCGPNQGLPDMSQHYTTLAPKPPHSQWLPTTKPPTSAGGSTSRRRGTPPSSSSGSGSQATGKVYWSLGKDGSDCNAVCKALQGTCVEAQFNQKFTTMSVFQLSSQLNSQCSMTWTDDGVHKAQGFGANLPAQCINPRGCGVDPKGMCAVPKQQSHCTGAAPNGYARMCPCQKASAGTKMQPKQFFR